MRMASFDKKRIYGKYQSKTPLDTKVLIRLRYPSPQISHIMTAIIICRRDQFMVAQTSLFFSALGLV